jgi:hypothetical protein
MKRWAPEIDTALKRLNAHKNRVIELIEKSIGHQLTNKEREQLPVSEDVRWEKSVNWARYCMVQIGWLKSNSPRGYWELSEQSNDIKEMVLNP